MCNIRRCVCNMTGGRLNCLTVPKQYFHVILIFLLLGISFWSPSLRWTAHEYSIITLYMQLKIKSIHVCVCVYIYILICWDSDALWERQRDNLRKQLEPKLTQKQTKKTKMHGVQVGRGTTTCSKSQLTRSNNIVRSSWGSLSIMRLESRACP